MSFRKILTATLLLIALSVFAGVAHASDISFFIGAEFPGSIKNGDVKTALDNGPVYGVRFGRNFVRHLGLEHTLAFSSDFLFPSERGTCADVAEDCSLSVEESKGFIYSSNLMLSFPDMERMVPFLTAGAGLVHQYGDRNLPVGTKLTFNYGGGVKFPNLAGPLGGRVDFRGYRAGIFSKNVNIFEFSIGLLVSFGR